MNNFRKSNNKTATFSIHPDFDSYQRKILNNLGYFGISLHHIDPGRDRIRTSSPLAQFMFYFTVINSLIKLTYIFYLLNGEFNELDFLDKISATLYLLIFGIMTVAYTIWFKRYPLYEIIRSMWTIEKGIFQRLGQPPKLKREVDRKHRATVWIHLGISWIGCICFIVQYYADPKYCTLTYALFDQENWILFTIFGAHEFLFMLHAWNLMTGSNSLFTFQAVALTNLIEGMTRQIQTMAHKGVGNAMGNKGLEVSNKHAWTKQDPYDVDKIIFDYKQLMLITELYNDWVSYKTVFLHACGYFQFISDVFLAVQVLRLPGTGIFDIWFYIEDSLASMYMIYRVYEFMSRVHPASAEFFRALNHYLGGPRFTGGSNQKERKRLQKVIQTLKMTSVKIGPSPVKRSTVLSAMEILSNYYICVALW